MKIHFYFLAFFLFFQAPFLSSQIIETIRPPEHAGVKMSVNTNKSDIQIKTSCVYIDPKTIAKQTPWDITFEQHGVNHEGSKPQHVLDSIERSGEMTRQNHELLLQVVEDVPPADGTRVVTPVVQKGFKGNAYNGWAPNDNNIAVSDDGFIVSVINTNILFADVTGQIVMEKNLNDFLATTNLNGGYFDPKLLYDPEEDKFILVVLNGNTPATSNVVIGFSKSSDPNQGWYFYVFPGDPVGTNTWFDYPSIGITTDELFVSGNLYSAQNNFSQVVIYQIAKDQGFTGGSVEYTYWWDIRDAYGNLSFTVVPCSYGFDGSVGPGIILVSTNDKGGSEAVMYYIDNTFDQNPNFYSYNVPVPNYYTPFTGLMKGTTDKIKTNDCRTLSGFYADGMIHFVFNTRGDDFHTQVYYCRLSTADLVQTTLRFGLQSFEYAFPSIAPFSNDETDKSVLIGFLRTSGSIFPEFRVAVVDHEMTYAGSVLVKEGESFTNHDTGPLERWGDYTGIAKRHYATGVEVWVAGSYGEDNDNGQTNVLGTWIAQVTDGQAGTAPVANFNGDPTTIVAGESVAFTDLSTNNPTSWSWSFPGGNPATSNQLNPIVTYNTAGDYNVSLTVTNAIGNDDEVKYAYIHVSDQWLAPVADFTSDMVSVSPGDAVHFEDMSVNTPTTWQWIFPGGTPNSSTVKNPVVEYAEPGCYDVTLLVSNAAGNDAITRTCYIDVLTATTDPNEIFTRFVLYPNPVSTGRVSVEFELDKPSELDFTLVDERGSSIKSLLHRRVKAGVNNLSFNTDQLVPGAYFLVVQSDQSDKLHSAKFLVVK